MSGAPRPGGARARVATYRLQLGPGATLDDAAERCDHVAALGASHLYLSPVWPAVHGSTHGYDVVAHDTVRAELGGEPALARLAARAHAAGLGLVLDVVPSHVAATPAAPLWRALLTHGRGAAAAEAFDVDWTTGDGRVLLPLVEEPQRRLLERGALGLAREDGALVVTTPAGPLPGSPEAFGLLLATARELADAPEARALGEALATLPDEPRRREAALVELEPALARLLDAETVRARVDAALTAAAADPERLEALLARQHWRLVPWREPLRNYRRFFDIDGLAALRSDRPAVFRATHAALGRWVEAGWVDGLRVDHVDGLADPAAYLEQLRALAPDAWLLVEKILAEGERLPDAWPVDGTTGYELADAATRLFVERAGLRTLVGAWQTYTGEAQDWPAEVRAARRDTLARLFPSELERAARAFTGPGAADPASAVEALAELLVELDVYRTYVRPGSDPSTADRARLEDAAERAAAARPDLRAPLDALRAALLLERDVPADALLVERVQTLSPALTAKAVEDTALYRWTPLVALNDVGAEPAPEAVGPEAFHATMAGGADDASLFPLSTHDAKRSADVRARLALLSQCPREWADALQRWTAAAAPHRDPALDRGLEHLAWQTLVGAWPLSADRAVEYLRKAAREAKRGTSWRRPDAAYEDALERFVRGVLADDALARDVERFVRPLVDPGRVQSLGLVLAAATARGVPDLYQGEEREHLALVDPDNRRPVDFAAARALAAGLADATPTVAWERRAEGGHKLLLWRRALHLRRRLPAAFGPGARYAPLAVEDPRWVAWTRVAPDGSAAALALCPCRALDVQDGPGDARLALPPGRWRDALADADELHAGSVAVAALTAAFPVALLAREERVA